MIMIYVNNVLQMDRIFKNKIVVVIVVKEVFMNIQCYNFGEI